MSMILPYRYRAELVRVVDADTLDMRIDLGMHTFIEERFRVFGIDAWETRGPEREKGLAAKTFVQDWTLSVGRWPFIVDTHKDKKGKYGRWLATVWSQTGPDVWVSLAWDLVANGHAEWRDY